MPYSAPTRTVGEAKQYIKRVFGDESGAQLEDADIIMFINVALDEINNRNHVLKESTTMSVNQPGRADYTFPDKRILQVEALLCNGQLVRNVSYSHALENFIGGTDIAAGQPLYWWEWGGKFTFFPAPGEGSTIQLDYTVRHQPVTNDDDAKLPLPDKFYGDIISKVLEQCYELDEQVDLAKQQAEKFASSLNAKNDEEREAQQMTYPVITLVD